MKFSGEKDRFLIVNYKKLQVFGSDNIKSYREKVAGKLGQRKSFSKRLLKSQNSMHLHRTATDRTRLFGRVHSSIDIAW